MRYSFVIVNCILWCWLLMVKSPPANAQSDTLSLKQFADQFGAQYNDKAEEKAQVFMRNIREGYGEYLSGDQLKNLQKAAYNLNHDYLVYVGYFKRYSSRYSIRERKETLIAVRYRQQYYFNNLLGALGLPIEDYERVSFIPYQFK